MVIKLNVIDQDSLFKCNQCGSCCSKLRGMAPREDAEFMKKMAYGKLPLVQLVPLEQMTFPLWDWEAVRFREWQNEAAIDGKIKPSRAIFDLSTNTSIIVSYFMDADSCPFLREKKCSIYNKKRAYVCRLFPFNRGPFLDIGEIPNKINIFGTCGGLKKLFQKMPENFSEFVKFLNNSFPDGSFENAVQHDIIIEWINKTIVDLMKKKLLKAAMNYPYNFLLKRIQNSRKMDFTEFLVEINYYSRAEMLDLIKRFDDNIDAKEKIKEFCERIK